jgi:cysteine synthase A
MAPSCATSKALVVGLLSGSAITLLATGLFCYFKHTKEVEVEEENEEKEQLQTEIVDGVDGLIGNTPLMRIKSLSEATGCLVLVNCIIYYRVFFLSY